MAVNAGAIATAITTLSVAGYVAGAGVSGIAGQLSSPTDSSQQAVNASSQLNSQSDSLTAAAIPTTSGNTNSQRNAKTVPEPPATLETIGLVLGAGVLLKVLKRKKILKPDTQQHQ